jgi:hypothetical protein
MKNSEKITEKALAAARESILQNTSDFVEPEKREPRFFASQKRRTEKEVAPVCVKTLTKLLCNFSGLVFTA